MTSTAASVVESTPSDDTPWVWFDVDDVLVSSTPLFQESMDRWSGKTVPWQTWTHNHFHKFYGVADNDLDAILSMRKMWEVDRVLERSPLYPEVYDTLMGLREDGFSIGLLTARAWHPRGLEITQAMVEEHHLPVSRVITLSYDGTKANLLHATGTRIVGFIDDTIRHVEGCRAAGFDAVLRHQPWNDVAQHLPRMETVADFPAWVKASMLTKEQAALEESLDDAPRPRVATPPRR